MTKFDRDFEEWYKRTYLPNCEKVLIKGTDMHYFNLLTIEMQFGVYVLFANEYNRELLSSCYFHKYQGSEIHQAMQEAVKQFKEWYNNNK